MQSIFQILVKSTVYTHGIKSLVAKSRGAASINQVRQNSELPLTNVYKNISQLHTKNHSSTKSEHHFTISVNETKNQINIEKSFKIFPKLHSAITGDSSADFQKMLPNQFREWQNTEEHDKYMQNPKGKTFTLLSYNILAQNLLESHLYLYDRHDCKALNWRTRFQKLVDEIMSLSPHLLCLQEVQESHLDEIKKALKPLDLSVIYKKRTGYKDDGCAILYNHKLFNLVEQHTVEYYQPQIQVLNRENVAIIVKLSLKNDENISFVVATTHLLYNPRRQDIRLAQVQVLLAELDRIASTANDKYVPVILTGDFNLQPYSAPYRLLVQGLLKYEGLKAKTLENIDRNGGEYSGKTLLPSTLGISDDCQHVNVMRNQNQTKLFHSEQRNHAVEPNETKEVGQNVKFESGELKHRFNFSSVYKHNIGKKDQEASTFQNQWVTVDYIFYSQNIASTGSSKISLLSRYKLPSVSRCAHMGMVPNRVYGSDHLALAAKFLISPTSGKL